MRATIIYLTLFPCVLFGQQLVCDFPIEQISKDEFKLQLTDFDSLTSNETCFLFWLANRKEKPDGKLYIYDENGSKREMLIFQNNNRIGTHLGWYATGELEWESNWKDDELVDSKFFYKTGTIKSEYISVNLSKSTRTRYYENGQLKSVFNSKEDTYSEWYPNGQLKTKGTVYNGYIKTGNWITYDENGQLIDEKIYTKEDMEWYREFDSEEK